MTDSLEQLDRRVSSSSQEAARDKILSWRRVAIVAVVMLVNVAPVVVFVLSKFHQSETETVSPGSSFRNGSTVSQEMQLDETAINNKSLRITQVTFTQEITISKNTSPTVNDLNVDHVSCRPPFKVPHDPTLGVCVPPCPGDEVVLERSHGTAFRAIVNIFTSVDYTCCAIIFYTWIKAKQLHRFPHIIILIMGSLNFVRVVTLSIPLFLGRRRTMCHYDDLPSSINHHWGTTFCQIQGGVINFTFLSTFIWFCVSVLNVLIVVRSDSTDNIVIRRPKTILFLESLVATIVPGSIVASVYRRDMYHPDAVLRYACLPGGDNNIFYTYTLPTQICCIFAMIMCILVIQSIKQSDILKSSHPSCSNNAVEVARMGLGYRFSFLVVFMPLLCVIMSTLFEAFLNFQKEQFDKDIHDFALCVFVNTLQDKPCKSSIAVKVYVVVMASVAVYSAAFSILLVVYSFIPVSAREVWARHLEQLREIFSSFRMRDLCNV